MAHESHYSQFLLGINPLMNGLEHSHELLGIQSGIGLLETPVSKHQSSHFLKDFIHRDLPESSNRNFLMSTDKIGVLESLHHSDSGVRLQLKAAYPQQQQLFHQEMRDFTSQQPFHLKNSEYLKPVQDLLSEFCNLGGENSSKEKRPNKASHWEEREPSSSAWQQSLYSMNHLELHKLKIKLLSMLEEVDRRYGKYCEQMKAAVSSFESMAGEGAANVYSTSASKAMSKHFRRLKDGIVGQIKAVKKAMGEKDPIAPGITRGETPRLKLLDQFVRQQKALQQGIVQQLPWRPQRGLPEYSVSVLRAWLFEHFLHPYPSDVDKIVLARQTGLSRSQVSNWFINARVRIWKPMVEEMYSQEIKELENQCNHPTTGHQHRNSQNPNPKSTLNLDQKPLPVQLGVNDSESLSSIINSSHHSDLSHTYSSKTLLHHQSQHHQQISGAENFNAVDFDFSYSNLAGDSLRSGVSLTLGLQQHSKGGMSLSFSPASQQSLLFGGEHNDHGQVPVGFSIVDGEAQTLPYRNLMGFRMLHDLAG